MFGLFPTGAGSPRAAMEADLQLYPMGAFGTASIYNLNGATGLVLTLQPKEEKLLKPNFPASEHWL